VLVEDCLAEAAVGLEAASFRRSVSGLFSSIVLMSSFTACLPVLKSTCGEHVRARADSHVVHVYIRIERE
jgi:hypothetical protein